MRETHKNSLKPEQKERRDKVQLSNNVNYRRGTEKWMFSMTCTLKGPSCVCLDLSDNNVATIHICVCERTHMYV